MAMRMGATEAEEVTVEESESRSRFALQVSKVVVAANDERPFGPGAMK